MKKIALGTLGALMLASCGGVGQNDYLTSVALKEGAIVTQSTSITGPLSDCYTIVQKDYVAEDIVKYSDSDDHKYRIDVEFEGTGADLPFDKDDVCMNKFDYDKEKASKYLCELEIDIFDAAGNHIANSVYGTIDEDNLDRLIKSSGEGEKTTVKFHYSATPEEKPAYFRIKSIVKDIVKK